MADAVLVRQGVHVEAIGSSVTIPNNNIAKLMYYLNCMSACLEDFIPAEFTNYSKYASLDNETRAAVVAIAILLDPEQILGKVVFVVKPNNPILQGSSNKFYKITEATQVLAGRATFEGAILIEGRTVEVSKIMFCTEDWYKKFLLDPLQGEIRLLQSSSSSSSRSTYGNGGKLKITSGNIRIPEQFKNSADKVGSMTKQGGVWKTWKTRHFVLKDNYLFYFGGRYVSYKIFYFFVKKKDLLFVRSPFRREFLT